MPGGNDGSFRFVLIPADPSRPVEERVESKAGGISDDALIAHARRYFADEELQASSAASSEEQTKLLAQEIRQQISSSAVSDKQRGTSNLLSMSDDDLVSMFHSNKSTCDITALTVPTERNQHTAVSMYVRDGSGGPGSTFPLNVRATQLAASCGHASTRVFGDAFVGRARDDEADDVWERMDFTADDADPASGWCRVASSPGGGGGSGAASSSHPASLSGLVSNAMKSNNTAVVDASGGAEAAATTDALFGMNGNSVVEAWGSWTQNRDEVELKFELANLELPSKLVKVSFARNHLKVAASDEILLEGKLFDSVQVDDCTYTVQTTKDGVRELCVTLSKAQEGRTWSWAVKA